jgi:dsRNA-specific ribonuclease
MYKKDWAKSPVSVLNDYVEKLGKAPPNYALIETKGGTHKPVFVYEVDALGITGKVFSQLIF